MGASSSKNSENSPAADRRHAKASSTSFSTPITVQTDYELDPRSPSANIARTPIQVSSATNENPPQEITGADEEIDLDNYNPMTLILGTDPRSPTTEYNRTPIVLKTETNRPILQIYNKNLDRARQAATPSATPKAHSKQVAPKLLGSSPVTTKPHDPNKRKSFVGLLETNLDFTETDVDEALRKKLSYGRQSQSLNDLTDGSVNLDPRSPVVEFVRTPIHRPNRATFVSGNIEDEEPGNSDEKGENDKLLETKGGSSVVAEDIAEKKKESVEVALEETEPCREEGLERPGEEIARLLDAEVQTDSDTLSKSNTSDVVETVIHEIVERVFEAISVVTERLTPTELNQLTDSAKKFMSPDKTEEPRNNMKISVDTVRAKSVSVKKTVEATSNKLVNVTADVKDFDKKLTNLIYEDDSVVAIPTFSKLKEGNRTPLGVRNSNSDTKRTTKLKVSDKPRNVVSSKIPVFHKKAGKMIQVQCENTPPSSKDLYKDLYKNTKPKKSHWDSDKTLFI